MRNINTSTLLLLIITFLVPACQQHPFQPQPGDILFQDLDCGELCDAIETVTQGCHGADFSHNGVIDTLNGHLVVIEAISAGVVRTPLTDFMSRSADSTGAPKVVVARLKKPYQQSVAPALAYCRNQLNKPYDFVYSINDSAYYCSELIYDAYRKKADNSPLFSLQAMTFKEPGTNTYFTAWQKYFKQLQHDIPEGQPGINPGLISRSANINIVHIYGKPSGWHTK